MPQNVWYQVKMKMKLSFVNRRRQKGIFSRQISFGAGVQEHCKRNFADVLVATRATEIEMRRLFLACAVVQLILGVY